ncbi:MAG TPA: hypothetical protein VH209_02260 [Steroidobacteraceae bacterium]|nr:hypothetical protein [Steroidobacteraceae bacterium]
MYDRTSPGTLARWVVAGLLAVSVSSGALAQQSPPPPAPVAPAHNAPRPEDLEPGVNTSAPPPPDSTSPGAATPHGASPSPAATVSGHSDAAPVAAKVGKSPASTKSVASAKPSGTGSAAPAAAGKPAAGASAGAGGSNSGAKGKEDRLQLDTTEITGNQELPKVLYIVPWKRADLGDLLGKPANSLLDEVLQPVDRDVFKRENRYYDALKPDASGGADKAAGAAGQGSGDKR